jgi:hypothetical protein
MAAFVTWNGNFSTGATSFQPTNNNYIVSNIILNYNLPLPVCYSLDNSWNLKLSWKYITVWLHKFNITFWSSIPKQHTLKLASDVTHIQNRDSYVAVMQLDKPIQCSSLWLQLKSLIISRQSSFFTDGTVPLLTKSSSWMKSTWIKIKSRIWGSHSGEDFDAGLLDFVSSYQHFTLMIEVASTSETSVNFYQTTRHYDPEDSHLHTCHHENLTSYLGPMSFAHLLLKITSQITNLMYGRPVVKHPVY